MSIQYKLKFTSIFQICLVCLFFHAFFQKGYWYWILILQFFRHTDTYSVFFRLNTDTDTSVFKNHTGYWILVFSFCTGQVSAVLYSNLMLPKTFLLTKTGKNGLKTAFSVWRWVSRSDSMLNLKSIKEHTDWRSR